MPNVGRQTPPVVLLVEAGTLESEHLDLESVRVDGATDFEGVSLGASLGQRPLDEPDPLGASRRALPRTTFAAVSHSHARTSEPQL